MGKLNNAQSHKIEELNNSIDEWRSRYN